MTKAKQMLGVQKPTGCDRALFLLVPVRARCGHQRHGAVSTNAFDPDRLVKAVLSGDGFPNPRALGLMTLAASLFLTILNTLLVLAAGIYSPYVYAIAAPLGLGGWWLVVTGQPRRGPEGSKAPMWSRAGLGACLVVGLLPAIAMCTLDWEPDLLRQALVRATGHAGSR